MPSPSSFRKSFKLFPGDQLTTFTARDGRQVWRVVDSHAGHDVVKQYERYDFPIRATLLCEGAVAADTVKVEPEPDPGRVSSEHGEETRMSKKRASAGHAGADKKPATSLEAAFAATLGDSLIVYSDYGSPYECKIGHVKVVPADSTEVAPEAGIDGHPCVRLTCHGVASRRRDLSRQGEDVADPKHVERATLSDDEKATLAKSYRVMRSFLSSGACKACSEPFVAKQWIAKRLGETARGGWIHARCALRMKGAAAQREPTGPGTSMARAKENEANVSNSRRGTRKPTTGDVRGSSDDVVAPHGARKTRSGSSPSRAGIKRSRTQGSA